MAGLRVAQLLGPGVILLEARPSPGGRVRSVYEKNGSLAYEAGPWRVGSSHERVRALCRELQVDLTPAPTPPLRKKKRASPTIPGLSTWDVHALHSSSAAEADAADLETGYADQTHSASGSAPYEVAKGSTFFVAPTGLQAFVDRLAEAATEAGADLRWNHMVQDVRERTDGRYDVHVRVRDGHNSFRSQTLSCDDLFLCLPPGACRAWTALQNHARCVLSSVEPGELHHIYSRGDERVPRGLHVSKNDLLGQTVSSQYPLSPWFQASYSGGRVARFWHNLFLAHPKIVPDVLQGLLKRPVKDLRSHFWPVAFHRWRPVPGFDLNSSVRKAVRANSVKLPGVYIAGEAFSSHQAWMEGSLETAELAVRACVLDRRRGKSAVSGKLRDRSVVFVEGRTIPVKEWQSVHPGGAAPLQNHLGEDVTELMRQMDHSDHAWAVAFSLSRIL